ncbi:MAG TPA: hypothetical protein VGP76_28925 [Planctomycetaceae bacterium]|jgi:hypothetical protein|nr:hypothetical protein [Planctomycetaceae bacterium]
MATKSNFRLKGKNRDSYLELVLDFPLASIKSDKHLLEAQRVMDRLLAVGRLNEVLASKKPFSRQMIRKLADYFKVDVSVLAGNI